MCAAPGSNRRSGCGGSPRAGKNLARRSPQRVAHRDADAHDAELVDVGGWRRGHDDAVLAGHGDGRAAGVRLALDLAPVASPPSGADLRGVARGRVGRVEDEEEEDGSEDSELNGLLGEVTHLSRLQRQISEDFGSDLAPETQAEIASLSQDLGRSLSVSPSAERITLSF